MAYWRMAALVTLSAVAVIGAIVSVAVAVLSRRLARRAERRAPAVCAAALFRLRVLPLTVALPGAFGIVLPLFIWFEPRETHERIPVTLVASALFALALLTRAVWRAARGLSATRALSRAWRAKGQRLDGYQAPLPVFAIDEPFPVVAVVGVRRPVLFIATRVLAECSDDQVRAMILHECAHIDARDNLKRLLLRACPDFSPGRQLDEGWNRASEEAADAAAATRVPALTVSLAEALVRVARLAPVTRLDAPVSAFYPGGSVEARVRRLLEGSATTASPATWDPPIICLVATLSAAGLITAAPAIHQAIEATLAWLP